MLSIETLILITKARYNKPPYNDNYEKEQSELYQAYLNQQTKEKNQMISQIIESLKTKR